jgi:fucose permease
MIFTVSMTVGRVLGVPLLNRYGRVTILSSASVAAVVGLVLLITIDTTWVSVVAVVLWGLGASLGFPVAMSAAADDPSMGPVRVSVVATIAYGAFLVGPPMLGALGQTVGILNSLWVVVGLIMLSFFAIRQTKKPGT